MPLLWVLLGFACGSMPLSLWLGRLAGMDIRQYGDGNPGMTNAWRAGGWRLGVPAMLLDWGKGAVPVGTAYSIVGVGGWWLVPVALAPVLGSSFSPFLGFRGGKSVAVTFGIWTGLTLGEAPIILGLLLGLITFIQTNDAWTVIVATATLFIHLLLQRSSSVLVVVCAGCIAILLWNHRRELTDPTLPRGWLARIFRRAP